MKDAAVCTTFMRTHVSARINLDQFVAVETGLQETTRHEEERGEREPDRPGPPSVIYPPPDGVKRLKGLP